MAPTRRQIENNATFRRLKPVIDETYLKGRYVAIDDGRILADAATFPELAFANDDIVQAVRADCPDFGWCPPIVAIRRNTFVFSNLRWQP